MFKRALAVFLPLVLALFITSIASSQDAKKEPAKETLKKEAKAEMKTNLYSVECSPDCGFMARSENKNELTGIVIKHAHDIHGKDITEADVDKMMKTKTRAEGVKEKKGTKE